VSHRIAVAVAEEIYASGLATFMPKPKDLYRYMAETAYSTDYPMYTNSTAPGWVE